MLLMSALPVQSLSFRDSVITTAVAALGAHLIFKRYEPNALVFLSLLLVATPSLLSVLFVSHVSNVFKAIGTAFALYLFTLTSSIIIYRLSPFHPLANYPGPVLHKLSKFWMVYISSKGKSHVYIQKLHEQYGDIVRIGPNEVSIRDASAIVPLLGANGWPKGPNWNGRVPTKATKPLIALADPEEHARRRKFWNRGFNTGALKEYESVIERRALTLASQLKKNVNRPLDLSQWLSFFAYDSMSDMVFGGGTDMLLDHDREGLWEMLDESQPLALFLGHVPWLADLYMRIPGAGEDLMRHNRMARRRAEKRAKEGSLSKDLYYYLNDEAGFEPARPPMSQVINDGGLAIIGGADTISTTLANIFWFLLRDPERYTRLQAEIGQHFPLGENVFDAAQHTQLYYLNAVINETLRLFPPILSGSQRTAPPGTGGKLIGSNYLPEGTMAFIHTYSVHRDPRNFSPAPESFIPERWLPEDQKGSLHASRKGDVVHNTAAFIPFSFGPAMCVGKNLALQEMRMAVCMLMQRFEFRFAQGFEPASWEANIRDLFVTMRGDLQVVVTSRYSEYGQSD